MDKFIAIFARYGSIETEEKNNLKEAIHFFESISENGDGYELGIYDPINKTMHVPENMDIAGQDRESILKQKIGEFKDQSFEFDKIEFYGCVK